MDVRCDRCETEYELDDEIVTAGGASVQCTSCGHTFTVTRARPAVVNPLGPTPPLGTELPVPVPAPALAPAANEPAVPEWTLSTDDGKVHRFRDLNTLQKWIVERKVARSDRMSRAGGPWLSLGDVVELTPFFNVVDEADRARASAGLSGGMPTAPRFPSSTPRSWSTPRSLESSDGGGSPGEVRPHSATPPPVPPDARRPVSEDGPTVPNRRLTSSLSGRALGGPAVALPGIRTSRATNRTSGMDAGADGPTLRAVSSSMSSVGSSPLADPFLAPSSSPSPPSESSLSLPATSVMVAPAYESGRLPLDARATRGPGHLRPSVTTETEALESEFLDPSLGDGGRRKTVAVVLVVAALFAAGAAVWWSTGPHAPASTTATATVTATSAAAKKREAPFVPTTPAASSAPSLARLPTAHSPAARSGPTVVVATGPASPRPPLLSRTNGGEIAAPRAPAGRSSAAASVATAAPAASTHGSGRGAGEIARGRPPADVAENSPYEKLVADGDRLRLQGKANRADKLYVQALALRPEGVAALTGTGYLQLQRQRHLKAIETFRRALAVQQTFGPALFGLAEAYRARGDGARALGAYREYLDLAPDGADAATAARQISDLESASTAPVAAEPPVGDSPAPPDQAP